MVVTVTRNDGITADISENGVVPGSAQDRIRNEFSVDVTIAKTKALYEELMAEKRA